MKTIIVPTDFSPAATNAVNYAAEMAMAIKAGILLLHVYQPPVIYSEIPVAANETETLQNYQSALELLKKELGKKTGSTVNIETEIRIGIFFNELKAVCEYRKPYTVVMGSQGTSQVERMLFGSHTIYAMKHLMSPLITVPSGVTFCSLKKIGLACDFAEVVDTTPVDEIKMLVNDFNAELHLLNTGKDEVFDPGLVYEFGLLRQVLEVLKPHFHYISNTNTDQGIIDFAESNQLDLLVILPKRHGLLDKLVHKSHTKQLVLHSHVPVMALHQELYRK
jgi:nucleotide-binding universal stress UspA family protein